MADSEEEKSADYTGINILVFVIITVLYYAFVKPKFTLDLLKDPDSLADAARNQKYMSGIYFILVIFFQFITL